jgi:hypothetical protein
LDQVLPGAGEIERVLEPALADAREDLIDLHLVIQRIISEHIYLEVLQIAESPKRY